MGHSSCPLVVRPGRPCSAYSRRAKPRPAAHGGVFKSPPCNFGCPIGSGQRCFWLVIASRERAVKTAEVAAAAAVERSQPSCSVRSRRALPITLTDDSAMAAAAMIGDSRSPVNG